MLTSVYHIYLYLWFYTYQIYDFLMELFFLSPFFTINKPHNKNNMRLCVLIMWLKMNEKNYTLRMCTVYPIIRVKPTSISFPAIIFVSGNDVLREVCSYIWVLTLVYLRLPKLHRIKSLNNCIIIPVSTWLQCKPSNLLFLLT